MDYLDKLIPFAILGAVAAFVFFLLRRAARDKDAGNQSEDSTMRDEVRRQPGKVEEPVAVIMGEEPVVVGKQSVSQETPTTRSHAPAWARGVPTPERGNQLPSAATSKREDENVVAAKSVTPEFPHPGPSQSAKPKRKKRAASPAAPPTPVPMPIVTVLGLLQEKDSLAAAFLLREILAPPVSRRH
jgi:hypothetical protein